MCYGLRSRRVLKGGLLACKRWPFRTQKVAYRNVKGGFLDSLRNSVAPLSGKYRKMNGEKVIRLKGMDMFSFVI